LNGLENDLLFFNLISADILRGMGDPAKQIVVFNLISVEIECYRVPEKSVDSMSMGDSS